MTHASLYVVQVTDTHLFSSPYKELLGVNTGIALQEVLQAVAALDPQPDILLLTGDISQDGSAESYRRCREMLRPLALKTYWLPGNHDVNTVMATELGQVIENDAMRPDTTISQGGWRLVLLDSSVEGEVGGWLSDSELQRLDRELDVARNNGEYALVSLHHPPFLMESHWLDTSTLANSQQLLQRLDRAETLRVVAFGHVHQQWEHQREGVVYMACPSTCVQFEPRSDRFALQPIAPGFRQFWLNVDGTFETNVVRVPAAAMSPNAMATGY